jgi:hypothetical protein
VHLRFGSLDEQPSQLVRHRAFTVTIRSANAHRSETERSALFVASRHATSSNADYDSAVWPRRVIGCRCTFSPRSSGRSGDFPGRQAQCLLSYPAPADEANYPRGKCIAWTTQPGGQNSTRCAGCLERAHGSVRIKRAFEA